jgi:NAD(P)-dependent dehydrogenase (short-subunit alcohol dehydrogenase family)
MQAAKESLTRSLSAELAPHGIRVVGLLPQGMPETAPSGMPTSLVKKLRE